MNGTNPVLPYSRFVDYAEDNSNCAQRQSFGPTSFGRDGLAFRRVVGLCPNRWLPGNDDL